MDLRSRLFVFTFDGDFTDISAECQNFVRDPVSLDLAPGDFLYVGYTKPINALYAAIQPIGDGAFETKVEYFADDATWKTLTISDDTKGLRRNGFITWERVADADKSAVNDTSAYWLRLSFTDLVHDPAHNVRGSLQGLNLVFADDNDIASEAPALIDEAFYPAGQTSHILQHVATKNYIISRLRNLGYMKITEPGDENINQWDLLDIYEIRQAAMYYAISQIYFNLSDNVEDQYWAKYKQYERRFDEAFGLGSMRIDTNNNGKVDPEEKRPIRSARWFR